MTISVVIPALDEAEGIAGAIGSVVEGAFASGGTDARSADSAQSARSAPGSPRSPRSFRIRLGIDPPDPPGADPSGSGPPPGSEVRGSERRGSERRGSERRGRETATAATAGAGVGTTAGRVAGEAANGQSGVDVCVVDGGSRDDTVSRARRAADPRVPLRILESAGGRARQLQAGLEGTRGDIVLFLHADTRLPSDWRGAVEAALAPPGVAGGAFRFAFGEPDRAPGAFQTVSLRLVEWGARWRAALFGLPYGDQALFARRMVLEEMGGIPQVPLMEDLDLVDALKRRGRLVLLPQCARTSPRRHLEGGVWRTALQHVLALLGWCVGVDRGRLSAWLAR